MRCDQTNTQRGCQALIAISAWIVSACAPQLLTGSEGSKLLSSTIMYSNASSRYVVGVNDTRDITITLNFTTGSQIDGLVLDTPAAPFSYKGGKFPGTGGTCSAEPFYDYCTVVYTMAPTTNQLSTNTIKVYWKDSAHKLTTGGKFSMGVQGTNLVQKVYAGGCAILKNGANSYGDLKCWGHNGNMLLGRGERGAQRGDRTGDMGDNLTAIDLGGNTPAEIYTATSDTQCARFNDGRLKCWGRNNFGQLGTGDTTTRGRHANEMGSNLPYVDLGTGRTVKKVSIGSSHICAILDNDLLKCWGYAVALGNAQTANNMGDEPGEMGDGLAYVSLGTGRTVKEIISARHFNCVILDNDKVKCWGINSSGGRLGAGNNIDVGNNYGEMGDNLPYVDLGTGLTAKHIYANFQTVCVILNNDKLKCWGDNTQGQLGLGDTNNRGDDPGEMGDNLPYVDVGTGRTVKSVSMANYSTCAILDNDTLKCWGKNDTGQLGQGDVNNRGDNAGEMGDSLAAINLGTGRYAVAVSANSNGVCALLDNAKIKCWGEAQYGSLGYENSTDIGGATGQMGDALGYVNVGTGRTVLQVIRGGSYARFTCAILDDHSIKCWGAGQYGNLGLGVDLGVGDEVDEMGDQLPAVNVGAGRYVTKVVRGDEYACALLDDKTVKCWGYNTYGQLGSGNTTAKGFSSAEITAMPVLDFGAGIGNIIDIDGGSDSTCILTDTGIVKCWGRNSNGRLGVGSTAHKGDNAGEMGASLTAINFGTYGGGSSHTAKAITVGTSHACAILNDDSVKCWGNGAGGRLGNGATSAIAATAGTTGNGMPYVSLGTGLTAKQISAGYAHTCALLSNDTVKCWGDGSSGNLGYENTQNRGDTAGQMGDNLPAISLGTGLTPSKVIAGRDSSCVIFTNGKVKCFGANGSGQHGVGDTTTRGKTAGTMGDNLPFMDVGAGRTVLDLHAGHRSMTYLSTCVLMDNYQVKCFGDASMGRNASGDTSDRGGLPTKTGSYLEPLAF